MKEHNDLGRGDKLPDELAKDDGCSFTGFIEEDTEAFNGTKCLIAERVSELKAAIFVRTDEMACRESIARFREPLLLLSKSPQNEDRS